MDLLIGELTLIKRRRFISVGEQLRAGGVVLGVCVAKADGFGIRRCDGGGGAFERGVRVGVGRVGKVGGEGGVVGLGDGRSGSREAVELPGEIGVLGAKTVGLVFKGGSGAAGDSQRDCLAVCSSSEDLGSLTNRLCFVNGRLPAR